MKKILLTSALAVANLITVPAFSKSSLDGFYVGASAGHSSLDAKEKIGIINPLGPDEEKNTSPRLKSNNFVGSAHAGYGWSFKNIGYFGLELSANYDNHKTKYNYSDSRLGSNLESHLSRKWSFGFNITPGFYLKEDILALFKVGAVISKFKYKAEDNYTDNGVIPPETSFLAINKTNNLAGFNLGGALKVSMTECLSLRLDVDHTIYRKFKVSEKKSEEHQVTTNIKPSSTTIMVGFSYKV